MSRLVSYIVIGFFLWGIGDYRPDIRQEFYGGGIGYREQIGIYEPYIQIGAFAIESSPTGKGKAVFLDTRDLTNLVLNVGVRIKF